MYINFFYAYRYSILAQKPKKVQRTVAFKLQSDNSFDNVMMAAKKEVTYDAGNARIF